MNFPEKVKFKKNEIYIAAWHQDPSYMQCYGTDIDLFTGALERSLSLIA